MKKYIWIVLLLFIFSSNSYAAASVVVDWGSGKIISNGYGAAPKEASPAEGKLVARVFAEADAHKKLGDMIAEIKVNDSTTGKNYIEKDPKIKQAIEALVKNANATKIDYFDDNTAAYQLEAPLYSGLGMIIYPHLISGEAATSTIESTTVSSNEVLYTGLIVEVGTSEYQPAMLPKILDQKGNEIYGPRNMNLGYVISNGAVYYSSSLPEAKAYTARIGSNPILVKAIAIAGSNECDVVVSDQDGYNIVNSDAKSKFFKDGKVIFVLKK